MKNFLAILFALLLFAGTSNAQSWCNGCTWYGASNSTVTFEATAGEDPDGECYYFAPDDNCKNSLMCFGTIIVTANITGLQVGDLLSSYRINWANGYWQPFLGGTPKVTGTVTPYVFCGSYYLTAICASDEPNTYKVTRTRDGEEETILEFELSCDGCWIV